MSKSFILLLSLFYGLVKVVNTQRALYSYQSAHGVKSECSSFLSLPRATSVRTIYTDKCVELRRAGPRVRLRPLGRDSVSMRESLEPCRSLSNNKAASWQTVHNKGTVVLFPLRGISSLLAVCLTVLWESLMIYLSEKRNFSLCDSLQYKWGVGEDALLKSNFTLRSTETEFIIKSFCSWGNLTIEKAWHFTMNVSHLKQTNRKHLMAKSEKLQPENVDIKNVGGNVRWWGLNIASMCGSSQGCWMALRSGLCAGHSCTCVPSYALSIFYVPLQLIWTGTVEFMYIIVST